MIWYDLAIEPPTDDEYAVMLLPCKTDCGLLYTTSNPVYARVNGVKHGYTHWARIQPAPGHRKWKDWQDNLK
jgi:hypothetical protein